MTILNPDNSPDVDAFIFHLEMLGFDSKNISISGGGYSLYFNHRTKYASLQMWYRLKDDSGSNQPSIKMAIFCTNMPYFGCSFHTHEFMLVKRSDIDTLLDSYRVRKETEKQLRKEMKARMEEFNVEHCRLIKIMQPNAK